MTIEDFWDNVLLTNGCWFWTGNAEPGKYGYLFFDGRKRRPHEVSYERINGPIPAGLELDHTCEEKLCVRPDHLEAVTHKENVRRYWARRKTVTA